MIHLHDIHSREISSDDSSCCSEYLLYHPCLEIVYTRLSMEIEIAKAGSVSLRSPYKHIYVE